MRRMLLGEGPRGQKSSCSSLLLLDTLADPGSQGPLSPFPEVLKAPSLPETPPESLARPGAVVRGCRQVFYTGAALFQSSLRGFLSSVWDF